VNLASNFFVGNVPQVNSSFVTSDFRFNFFNNCHKSCCLLNLNCTPQCLTVSESQSGPLPLGVESSVWTELNVTLLGERKRIIQIETHFTSSPHLVRSFACPNTSTLETCDNTRLSTPLNDSFDGIPLKMNVPYSFSQPSSTYQKYVYFIEGDVCTTNVKVIFYKRKLQFHFYFVDKQSSRLL